MIPAAPSTITSFGRGSGQSPDACAVLAATFTLLTSASLRACGVAQAHSAPPLSRSSEKSVLRVESHGFSRALLRLSTLSFPLSTNYGHPRARSRSSDLRPHGGMSRWKRPAGDVPGFAIADCRLPIAAARRPQTDSMENRQSRIDNRYVRAAQPGEARRRERRQCGCEYCREHHFHPSSPFKTVAAVCERRRPSEIFGFLGGHSPPLQ